MKMGNTTYHVDAPLAHRHLTSSDLRSILSSLEVAEFPFSTRLRVLQLVNAAFQVRNAMQRDAMFIGADEVLFAEIAHHLIHALARRAYH